jgi:hypothetical protein
MDFWLENSVLPRRHIVVDCGPWAQAEQRFKRLRQFVGLRQFLRVGNGRLVARLPPRTAPAVLAAMPEIQPGAHGYCWCTHGFVEASEVLHVGGSAGTSSTSNSEDTQQ